MNVHEAWSPENSDLIFRGGAACNAVRSAIDASLEIQGLDDKDVITLTEIATRVEKPDAGEAPKQIMIKTGMELDLLHKGLARLVHIDKKEATFSERYRAWQASRLVGKIARATI